ncbi:mitogen-activated protein kinase kinase kinase 18-like, partial [Oryza brachyantha]|uniref:mitogen-activated protein kinase kinase kinase 18-like n=1 Tax=Oryza brachyantha TaxID=4533 RepID=UPI001ADC7A5F
MVVGEWTRGPAIGRGSSAVVSLAVDCHTGEFFAVKSVGADRAGELLREQSIMCDLSSPYVLRCLGSGVSAAEDGGTSYDMFLEYAPGGSLADEIKRCGGGYEDSLIRSRARDILCGLAHVHAAGVAHCDVKGRNILIGSDGHAMIADFGCARRVAVGHGGCIAGGRPRGGTPMFMAPEAARGEEQGPAVDIWALGCTVIEMATGGAPWPEFTDPVAALHHVAFSGEVPEFPRWLSDDGKDFLARCLQRDPRERWTAEQLLDHRFVVTVASSSSNSMPRISDKDIFVSPKSILDQVLWDDSTADTNDTAAPTDRVRSLAAGAPVVPDWTWDANWITVHSGSIVEDDDTAALPEGDDGDSDRLAGSSTPAGSPTSRGSHASHGDSCGDVLRCNGDCYGDMSSCSADCYGDVSSCYDGCSERFCGGNHVMSDCTPAITSKGFFPRCCVTTTFGVVDVVTFFLSELAVYFPPSLLLNSCRCLTI